MAVLFVFSFVGLYAFNPTTVYERTNGIDGIAFDDQANELPTETRDDTLSNMIDDEPDIRRPTYVATPEAVKGIYMTSCVAATPSLRNNLIKLAEETEINSIVIDVKTYDGHLAFMPENEELKPAAGGGCFVRNMQDIIDDMHSKGIYVIARIAVFQDVFKVNARPDLAVKKASDTSVVWRDHKGIPWIDPSSQEHWQYIASIAREAHAIGIDEINFDYIRFPSDGNMKDIHYPLSGDRVKREVMREFFKYLHDELSPEGMVISADLFGMVTTNIDDLNIGQVLEDALPYFDYIAPMVYPSHYPKGFMGLGDPNQHVYEVVNWSMKEAVRRTVATTTSVVLPDARIGTSTPAIYSKPAFDANKLRPWLQDNNYPVPYTAEMVRAQIQAAYDAGLNSWLLWNAGNRYTRAALKEGE